MCALMHRAKSLMALLLTRIVFRLRRMMLLRRGRHPPPRHPWRQTNQLHWQKAMPRFHCPNQRLN